jgi:hypothetical protein
MYVCIFYVLQVCMYVLHAYITLVYKYDILLELGTYSITEYFTS